MKTRIPILPLAALAGVAIFAAPANAQIITPTGATTSTALLGGSYGPGNTIDGSGLSGGGASGDILSETHADEATNSGTTYLSASGVVPELTFDLGGTFTVDSVHIWNYRHDNGVVHWGVSTIDISFSTDGGSNYGSLIDDLGTFVTASNPESVQSVSFTAVSGVTHIKLTDVQDLGGPYTGFGEIRFGEAIPEPSSLALLGLGGLALLRRRRG